MQGPTRIKRTSLLIGWLAGSCTIYKGFPQRGLKRKFLEIWGKRPQRTDTKYSRLSREQPRREPERSERAAHRVYTQRPTRPCLGSLFSHSSHKVFSRMPLPGIWIINSGDTHPLHQYGVPLVLPPTHLLNAQPGSCRDPSVCKPLLSFPLSVSVITHASYLVLHYFSMCFASHFGPRTGTTTVHLTVTDKRPKILRWQESSKTMFPKARKGEDFAWFTTKNLNY